jgi:hypothetical protein
MSMSNRVNLFRFRSRRQAGRRTERVRPRLESLEGRTLLTVDSYIGPNLGSWSVAANWSEGHIPARTEEASITNGHMVELTNTAGLSDSEEEIASLYIGGTSSLDVPGWALQVDGTTTVDGALSVSGGSMVVVGTATINGTLNLSAGSLGGNGDVYVGSTPGDPIVGGTMNWSGGSMYGKGTTNIEAQTASGLTTIPGGSLSIEPTIVVATSRNLTIAGAATWSGAGGIQLLSSTLDNQGSFTISNDQTITGGTVTNEGTITKSSGSGVTLLSGFGAGIHGGFDNTGTVDAESGTIAVGLGTSTGQFNAGAGAAIELSPDYGLDTLNPGATLTGSGLFDVGASGLGLDIETDIAPASLNVEGTLQGSGSVTVPSGGTDALSGSFAGTGTITVDAGGTASLEAYTTLDQNVVNQGTLNVSVGTNDIGNSIYMGGSTGNISIDNQAGATMNIAGGVDFDTDPGANGPQTIQNEGMIVFQGSSGNPTALFDISLVNTGNVQLQSGEVDLYNLQYQSSITNTGSFGIGAGATLGLNGCDIANSGTFAIAGSVIYGGSYTQSGGSTILEGAYVDGQGGLTVEIDGGTLTGSGTINGSLVNAAEVDPGGSGASGTITVGYNYTQTSTGVLNIDLGGLTPGTQFDQLVIGGQAQLDGTLNVSLIDGFTTNPGDSFTILTNVEGIPSGDFATENGLDLGNGETLDPVYATDPDTLTTTLSLLAVGGSSSTTTSLNPSVTSTVYGGPVTLTATVTGSDMPTGSVSFYNGATALGTVAVNSSGVAIFTTDALPVGSDSITAVYGGDATDSGSTSAAQVESVTPDATTTGVVSSSSPVEYGQPVTFTATIGSAAPGELTPTGFVRFKIDGKPLGAPVPLVGGIAVSTSTSSLALGSHTVTAVFSDPSGNFLGSQVTITQKVLAFTSTALSASTMSTVFGQPVTFTATVTNLDTANPVTGSVSFFDGTKLIGSASVASNQAQFTTSALAANDAHSITAVYKGSAVLGASTSSALVPVVSPANTNTALIESTNAASYGAPVTFTATVSNASGTAPLPTGQVNFYNGSTLIGRATLIGGVATLTRSNLNAQSYSISATYVGPANFNTSASGAVALTIAQASTSTLLASSLSGPTVYGTPVTLTATVANASGTSPVPSGAVSFYLDYVPGGTLTILGRIALTNGVAHLTTAALPAGNHTVTAVYSGQANFAGSVSAALPQSITAEGTNTNLTASPGGTVASGTVVTFMATVTDVDASATLLPAGKVAFYDMSAAAPVLLGVATIVNGKATFNHAFKTAGMHNVQAVYEPTTNFVTSTSNMVPVTIS